jgi:hypothetical protein
MRKIGLLIVSIAIAIISCNNEKTKVSKVSEKSTILDSGLVLTDNLVYGIATRASENADSSELAGFSTFLQGKLIDYLFDELYTGRLKAYDFFSEKELTINEIKEIEKADGFERSKIGKVQFNEQWVVAKNGVLIKQVNSMTLGIEYYSKQGTFLNYNALFTIRFNPSVQ